MRHKSGSPYFIPKTAPATKEGVEVLRKALNAEIEAGKSAQSDDVEWQAAAYRFMRAHPHMWPFVAYDARQLDEMFERAMKRA